MLHSFSALLLSLFLTFFDSAFVFILHHFSTTLHVEHPLTVLGYETIEWLLNTCPDI